MSRSSKMLQFVNWRMRVTISDTRTLLGTLMAFDRHMNIVLGDCEEYRKFRGKKASEDKEEKRMLGLVMLRGENVISLAAESPPLQRAKPKGAGRGGPGGGRAAGRGMPTAPLAAAPKGLTGPVRGVGGPAASQMMPTMTPPPQQPFGRGMPGRGGPVQGMPGFPPPPTNATGGPPMPPRPGFVPQQPPMAGRGMPPAPPRPGMPFPGGPPPPGMPPGFPPPRPGVPPTFSGGPPMNRPPFQPPRP